MALKDSIKLSEQVVKGLVEIQLYSAKTGKLEFVGKGQNVLTDYQQEFFRRQNRIAFSSGIAGGTSNPLVNCMNVIMLTDSTAPENPFVLGRVNSIGDVKGWSNKSAYSGADTKRGTPNFAESTLWVNPNEIKWVFDWPTHAANGTFQSIFWGVNYPMLIYVAASYITPLVDPSGLTWDGSNIWSCDPVSSNIHRHNMDATLSIAATYSPTLDFQTGITWDGFNIWTCTEQIHGSGKIYKHNMDATLSIAATYTAPSTRPSGLTWNGFNIWSCDSNTDRIYKHNMDATLSVAATYTAPGSMPRGLAWDGSNIWSCDSDTDRIYEHNMDATLSVMDTHTSPSSSPSGLTWDGSTIWNCDTISNRIYKISMDRIGTHYLHPTPITKLNMQTMKIIYTFVVPL